MRTESVPFLVGGGALAALLWSRKRDHDALALARLPDLPPTEAPDVAATAPSAPSAPAPNPPSALPSPLAGRWIWPMPRWRGRRPVVSDGFGSPRPGGARHEGVDLMFAREASDPYRAGTPNGAAHHVMPDDMVALAAADGLVWSAGRTPRGFSVVIDHAPLAPVATYYTHLSALLVAPAERGRSSRHVRAGEPIGIIGADPLDAAHLKHLHFAFWRGGPANPIDPQPLMARWELVDDPRAGTLVARNAALAYRAVGERGDDYPGWVRNLRGKSGVYVIRVRDADGDPVVVYVGESHTSRLYDTLTRHFQEVRHEAQEVPMT